jgi:hypothetical protein
MGSWVLPVIDVFAPGKRQEFHKMGDVNWDGVIDQTDTNLMQAAWQSTPSSPNWNPDCDLNGDGIVNAADLAILASHYGMDIWSWLGWGSQGAVEWSVIGAGIVGIAGVGILAGTKLLHWW